MKSEGLVFWASQRVIGQIRVFGQSQVRR